MLRLGASKWLTPPASRGAAQTPTCISRSYTRSHNRSYTTIGQSWKLEKVQHTKYRITKPWTSNTYYDDIFLAAPSKDDFAKFTKETPLFIRFLKLICDVEQRPQTFIEFAKRCENGLVVEKDVYITKKELIECIWQNGFETTEINAFEIAFPSDYKFHYPELAVLFDLSEEDCYKYCIKQRATTPEELVELNYKPPQNLLSSYGLCFLGVWFGLSNTVLSNAWFYSKTFPFGAVFYMLASYFYRQIREYLWKEGRVLAETAQQKKDAGEEFVYKQMKKYANDARCLDFLTSFKDDVQKQLMQYRKALAQQQKQQLVERATQKLFAIQQAEAAIQGSLQEVMVREVVGSFREAFASNPALREDAFRAAVASLSGGEQEVVDPVGKHFKESLQQLQKVELSTAKPNPNGSVVERVAALFQQKEREFLDQFTVNPEEAAEVRRLAGKCKSGNAYDFTKLSAEELKRFNELYTAINNRVGYDVPIEMGVQRLSTSDEKAKQFVDYINQELLATAANLRNSRLTAFAQAFD